VLAGLDGLPDGLGHLDLAGTLGAADAADGGSEQLGDIWRSWGHDGTVPRATVKDDPSGHETRYRGVSPRPVRLHSCL
jgi:hypothetical protein